MCSIQYGVGFFGGLDEEVGEVLGALAGNLALGHISVADCQLVACFMAHNADNMAYIFFIKPYFFGVFIKIFFKNSHIFTYISSFIMVFEIKKPVGVRR